MSQRKNYDPGLDEALLEHYDDIFDYRGYQNTLDRMRRNGYEPRGPAAPNPGSPFYKNDCPRDF